ncbi:class I SAM-dependent methyltransferase [Methylovirgula sp. 4M-Z18]|uniref:class I SAM-dependent methyltransferase n=1 Tax=Methylovirgula sp. 4M-Z18 TaxID=2293567 RepID=UPI001314FA81|nr:class I SAM-dependent methyltransferase [Methylovirgula sp. 4M-Z18]
MAAALPSFGFVRHIVADVNLLDIDRLDGDQLGHQSVSIKLGVGADVASRDLPITETLLRGLSEQLELRAQTKQWCMSRLRCPVCKEPNALQFGDAIVFCSSCAARFPQSVGTIDMLPPELRQKAKLTPATHVSSNPYEELALDLIRRITDAGGWVLDCGAGSRPSRMPRVVNLEIERYFSTDVLALGENLPFQDGVFDGVVSLATLEHVRDPFTCARELVRVVKPGGEVVCSVPFLQPVHGYPDHYYNMTRNGLINLFEDVAAIVDCSTPPNGHPIFAVQWILHEYLDGLPIAQRDRFGRMTIAEVAQLDPFRMLGDGIAADLSEPAKAGIACLNTVRLRRHEKAAPP